MTERSEMKGSATSENRFLVIEDEPAISEICQRVIADEGFEVDTAANGEAARDMLKRNAYTLILLDMKTPVMDGEQFYRYLGEKYPDLLNRVILTTGDQLGDTTGFLKQSNRPFLPKPFTPDELRDIVRRTFRGLAE